MENVVLFPRSVNHLESKGRDLCMPLAETQLSLIPTTVWNQTKLPCVRNEAICDDRYNNAVRFRHSKAQSSPHERTFSNRPVYGHSVTLQWV